MIKHGEFPHNSATLKALFNKNIKYIKRLGYLGVKIAVRERRIDSILMQISSIWYKLFKYTA